MFAAKKTNQDGPIMWSLVSMLVTLDHMGKIPTEIGVGMPHTQHGKLRDWTWRCVEQAHGV